MHAHLHNQDLIPDMVYVLRHKTEITGMRTHICNLDRLKLLLGRFYWHGFTLI